MKVLLLNGSPHPNGCTATALKEMIATFDAAGVETEQHMSDGSEISGMKYVQNPNNR